MRAVFLGWTDYRVQWNHPWCQEKVFFPYSKSFQTGFQWLKNIFTDWKMVSTDRVAFPEWVVQDRFHCICPWCSGGCLRCTLHAVSDASICMQRRDGCSSVINILPGKYPRASLVDGFPRQNNHQNPAVQPTSAPNSQYTHAPGVVWCCQHPWYLIWAIAANNVGGHFLKSLYFHLKILLMVYTLECDQIVQTLQNQLMYRVKPSLNRPFKC